MYDRKKNTEKVPIGLAALLDRADLKIPPPRVLHYAASKAATHTFESGRKEVLRDARYAPSTIQDHVEYALKYEALDLRAWFAICRWLDPKEVANWVSASPRSKYLRRLWYLYERLTETALDLLDSTVSSYVELANPELQIVSAGSKVARYKILDNLLGTFDYCPLVRRSDLIRSARVEQLRQKAHALVEQVDPDYMERAVDFLFHKETRASFQIEREDVSYDRMQAFVMALRSADSTRWYEERELSRLQNVIVEPRYQEKQWRQKQVFVGGILPWGEQKIHFICPRPHDVTRLMVGWKELIRMTTLSLDPICQAAVLGFGFVFIHPFEDGNGRLHRFVIHATLTRRKFTPDGEIVPVSVNMLNDPKSYDRALEAFSRELNSCVEYRWNEQLEIEVLDDTSHLYRFWDATPQCEYLFDVIERTIGLDLPAEIKTLRAYDAGRRALIGVIDMPNRRADLLMKLLIQNGYQLAKHRRKDFPELTEDELMEIERAVREAAEGLTSSYADSQSGLFDSDCAILKGSTQILAQAEYGN